MILDTNALSDLIDGNADVLKHLRTTRLHSLPVVVLGEFRFGLLRSRSRSAREQWLARLELEIEVLEITRATTHFYAQVREELRAKGQPIPSNDIWIAALALEHRLAILSKDSHFDRIEGVHRYGW